MTVAPWTDCPPCPACELAVGVITDRNERPLPPPRLYCPACGHQWQATTEDRAQAEAAERAWEAKVDR